MLQPELVLRPERPAEQGLSVRALPFAQRRAHLLRAGPAVLQGSLLQLAVVPVLHSAEQPVVSAVQRLEPEALPDLLELPVHSGVAPEQTENSV